MKDIEYTEQQYLQSLERSLRYIRNEERLSLEVSIEELCKLLLLQICIERKIGQPLQLFVKDLKWTKEDSDMFYQRLFDIYVPGYVFKGWDNIRLKRATLEKVVEELTQDSLFETIPEAKARAFTEFLQLHYSGYLSEYSTPLILSEFILDVINPREVNSIVDPCCGLGGFLVEAFNRKSQGLEIKGFDINQRMANTANLHLLMYGYDSCAVECLDMMEMPISFKDGPFDAIVSHLPQVHRVFSHTGKRNSMTDRLLSRNQEDFFINQILKMLKPRGIAAVVVSDNLLMSELRAESRDWLYKNAQILNITRFEGLAYREGANVRSYNVVFLKRPGIFSTDMYSAVLFKESTEEYRIKEVAMYLRKTLYEESPIIPRNENIRYSHLLKEENWNVNLLFAREKMGWKYNTRLLKELVKHDRQRVKVKDDKDYSQLTVKAKGLGVVERKDKYVNTTSSNNIRYEAHYGQLIISSLEADKGAVGIVPKNLDGALVSKNYYLFTITSHDVDPDYLTMVLSSEPVLRQLEFHKRSYVMSRISLEKLLSLVIPLPNLEDQKRLVNNLIKKVKKARQIQDELEAEQKDFVWNLFGEE